jgi:hypothetical protein
MSNKLREDGIAPVATNAMGASSSKTGTGPVDTYNPLLRTKKKLRDVAPMLKRKPV